MATAFREEEAGSSWSRSLSLSDIIHARPAFEPIDFDDIVQHAVPLIWTDYFETVANDNPSWSASTKTGRAFKPDVHREAIEARVERIRFLTNRSGNAFSRDSADALLAFCGQLKPDYLPSIFAVLSGNLRAIWRNEEREQIGIQFFPDGKLQYVLFRLEKGVSVETMGFELRGESLYALVADRGLDRLWLNADR